METVTGFETPEEAALELELPLLGTLPPPDINEGAGIAPAFPADERARREYHRAADRLLLSPHSRSGSIGLLGDVSPAHRALVASRLAASVAAERTAILVDADVRAAHLSFDETDRAQEGLVDVLRYGVRSPRVVAPTQTPGLNLLPVGSGTVDLEGTFGSDAVRALFEELGRTGDLLLINGPDLVDFRAAASFLAEVDAWILVHEIGVSDSGKTRRLRDTFGREKCVGILAVTAPEPAAGTEPAAGEPAAGAPEAAAIAGAAVSTDSLEIVHGAGAGIPLESEPVAPGTGEPAFGEAPPEPPAPEDPTQPTAVEFETAEAEALAEALAPVPELELEPSAPAPAPESEGVPVPEAGGELEPEYEYEREEASAPEPESEPESEFVIANRPSPETETETEAEAETVGPPDAELTEVGSSPVSPGDFGAPGLLQDPAAPIPAVAVPAAESSGQPDPAPAQAPAESPVGAASEAGSDELEHAVEASGGGGSRRPLWITLGVLAVAVVAFFVWRQLGGPTSGEGNAPPEVASVSTSGPGPGAGSGDLAPGPPVDSSAPGGPEAEGPADSGTPIAAGAAGSLSGVPVPPAKDAPSEEAAASPPPAETTTPTQIESAAPAEPPVERSSPVGTSGPRYGVHVASVKAEAGARREAARYEKAGYPTVLRQKEIPGKGLWWRVYVGPYGAKADASRLAGEIKQAGLTDYTQVHRLPEE